MKKMLVVLSMLSLTLGAAQAQTTPAPAPAPVRPAQLSPEQHADRMAQRLSKQLNLSTEQTARVREATLTHQQHVQALRATHATAGSRRGAGPELKTLRDTYDQQLKAILTPDQYTQYAQQRDARLEQRRAGRGPRGAKS